MSAPATPTVPPALELRDLSVSYRVRGRDRTVIDGLSLSVARGQSYGIVGESGCGKSTVALAVMRYLARGGRVSGGEILVDGEDIGRLDPGALRHLRSDTVAMVFQDPVAALNPTLAVGAQLDEVFTLRGADRVTARRNTLEALDRVRITDPRGVVGRYPHQLSGGMAQRVIIAAALAREPLLLVLDEPTTGLDATVEAEVLQLVADLQSETGTSVVLISHNLAVVAAACSRVGVLYAGRMAEEGSVAQVFAEPAHPYTVGLLRCLPDAGTHKSRTRLATIPGVLPRLGARPDGCAFADRCSLAQDRCRTERPALTGAGDRRYSCHFPERVHTLTAATLHRDEPYPVADRSGAALLSITDVSKTFGGAVRALHEVSLDIWAGETLGLVGESGSGKSTLARIMLGLNAPDEGGRLTLHETPLAARVHDRTPQAVGDIQIVFQNPAAALNPRHRVGTILGRAVRRLRGLRGAAQRARVDELTESVRLRPEHVRSRPGQLSGGMMQRVAIARAFAGEAELVVCDEPTSALDVSVQASILNLLSDLQEHDRVAYLLISHDLGVVRYLADRVAVMYLGEILEVGPVDAVFGGPRHPYTTTLLEAVPTLHGETGRAPRAGSPAKLSGPSTGCPYAGRCPHTMVGVCDRTPPPDRHTAPDHLIRCHLPLDTLRAANVPAEAPSDPVATGSGRP